MNEIQEQNVELVQEAAAPQPRLPLYAFFAGSAISYIGDALTLLAVPWFVLQTTGSVTQTGITAFFSTLPTALSALFGSVLIDHLGYKRTSVIGDILSGITVALVPLLYHTVGLAFWQLLILVFIGGLLKSPGVTARSSMVPELATRSAVRLELANSLSDGVNRVSGFIGAPLAGLLIAFIGASNLLWFDAISFACSALLIGLAVPHIPPVLQKEEAKEKRGYVARLREGLSFIRHDALLASLVITIMITNLLDGALGSVVMPAYVQSFFHSALPLGLLVAAFGGAAFVGTLIFAAIGHRLPRRLTLGWTFTIGGALRFWVMLVPILPILIGWNIIAGLAVGSINPLLDTVLQERVAPEMRARVFGTLYAGVMIGIPLGTFVSGYLVQWLGLQMTLIVMGTIYLASTLSLLINPALKGIDKPSSPAAS
ncbi:MFS transporter [Ktedonosporobacter rubrisoli]|uniref:MFS transporter n=1 Tax=Ktedonosporobacter rubrisoli TaxID=2509675 RepID=A0A4P6JYP0_KTERU|nr:MFS transporter [Ktedonosporobacter rubrisoli]QBD80570.1 MFS transporter [Ktedonosporobacter rubrisoli]